MLRDLRCFTIATSSWRSKTKLYRTPSVSWRKGNFSPQVIVWLCLKQCVTKKSPATVFNVRRLRAGECDQCAILEEKLKNNQEQNLRLVAKLSEFTLLLIIPLLDRAATNCRSTPSLKKERLHLCSVSPNVWTTYKRRWYAFAVTLLFFQNCYCVFTHICLFSKNCDLVLVLRFGSCT